MIQLPFSLSPASGGIIATILKQYSLRQDVNINASFLLTSVSFLYYNPTNPEPIGPFPSLTVHYPTATIPLIVQDCGNATLYTVIATMLVALATSAQVLSSNTTNSPPSSSQSSLLQSIGISMGQVACWLDTVLPDTSSSLLPPITLSPAVKPSQHPIHVRFGVVPLLLAFACAIEVCWENLVKAAYHPYAIWLLWYSSSRRAIPSAFVHFEKVKEALTIKEEMSTVKTIVPSAEVSLFTATKFPAIATSDAKGIDFVPQINCDQPAMSRLPDSAINAATLLSNVSYPRTSAAYTSVLRPTFGPSINAGNNSPGPYYDPDVLARALERIEQFERGQIPAFPTRLDNNPSSTRIPPRPTCLTLNPQSAAFVPTRPILGTTAPVVHTAQMVPKAPVNLGSSQSSSKPYLY